MTQFENVLLSNRKNLNPQESVQRVINYALLQDAKQRSRLLRHAKATWVIPALLFTYPAFYIAQDNSISKTESILKSKINLLYDLDCIKTLREFNFQDKHIFKNIPLNTILNIVLQILIKQKDKCNKKLTLKWKIDIYIIKTQLIVNIRDINSINDNILHVINLKYGYNYCDREYKIYQFKKINLIYCGYLYKQYLFQKIKSKDINNIKFLFDIKQIKQQGAVNGCWSDMHPTDKVTLAFTTVGRPFRLTYRPEIFLRDQQANIIELEKEHIEKSRKGEVVDVTSPLVLWN